MSRRYLEIAAAMNHSGRNARILPAQTRIPARDRLKTP
jgi:hypothetical protein